MPEDLEELKESLQALQDEAEDATATYRDNPSEDNRSWYQDTGKRLRWTRWKLRGGTGKEPGHDEDNQE